MSHSPDSPRTPPCSTAARSAPASSPSCSSTGSPAHDPVLNAFRVVTDEMALAEAAQADARRRSGDTRPLLGIPLAIKDDTDVQGQTTPMGSCAIGDEPATADSEVVRRLRSAGAVILGKTHVPEMMIVPFTETPTFGHHPQPVGPAAHPGRLQRRLRGGGRGRAVLGGARLRRRRLDPHPRGLLRAVRAQAAARPRADRAVRRAVARALDVGPDHAPRGRQRALLRRDPRRRRVVRRGGGATSPGGSGSRSPATSRR